MKTTFTRPFAIVAALAALQALNAQPMMPLSPDGGAGLLGQRYTGIEFGYTHHVESEPSALHRYGFVSHAPLPEMASLDGAFRYDYTRGSAQGLTAQTHRARAAFLRYMTYGLAKPFAEVELGWAWRKHGPAKEDSFLYQASVGAELPISPRFAVTPFVRFHEAANLGERAWNYGARLGYRPHRDWSALLTVQIDDAHNIEYVLGVQRRY